jgi:hypothetical protein
LLRCNGCVRFPLESDRRVRRTDAAIELNGVFTPDGREFFFTRLVDKIDTMFHARFADGKWSAPRPLMVYANEAKAVAVDMAVSPDGKELYFLGQHAHEYTNDPPNWDLWVSRLVNGVWTTARVLPPPAWFSILFGFLLLAREGMADHRTPCSNRRRIRGARGQRLLGSASSDWNAARTARAAPRRLSRSSGADSYPVGAGEVS